MRLQIKELILWSKNPNFEPRRVCFEPSKVNVITGASRTGKSAIIPIIDYCLASSKCSIPVKIIRDACSWFGILLTTGQNEILLARKNPGSQKQTGDMFVLEGTSVEIPKTIEGKNEDSTGLKRRLDELAGLTMLDYGEDDRPFADRPSFRDTVSFLFQSQNIIANQDILFYKANEHKYQERLRLIFPYVLNAVNPEWFINKHRLNELRKKLSIKEKEYSQVQRLTKNWTAEVRAKVLRAKELGLLDKETDVDGNLEYLIGLLKELSQKKSIIPIIDAGVFEKSSEDLSKLRAKENSLSFKLAKMKRRITEMNRLKDTSFEYHKTLQIMRDRLAIADWIEGQLGEGDGRHIEDNDLQTLVAALRRTEEELSMFSDTPAAFDREYASVKNDVDELSQQLRMAQTQIAAIASNAAKEKAHKFTISDANRFVGRLEEAMDNLSKIESGSELVETINILKTELKEISKLVSNQAQKRKEEFALERISRFASDYIKQLDSESPDDKITLDINSLTLIIKEEFRDNYLWEIGSGSNWLAYHLSALLALHTFFLTVNRSPVPSFVIFDQPSQVYFPKNVYTPADDGEYWDEIEDEDVESVKKIFSLMDTVVEQTDGKLQLMVFDHAPQDVWIDKQHIHTVEIWRDGTKLIPQEWLEPITS